MTRIPHSAPRAPRGIVFFNRRDTSNPEGGGSEVYVEVIARALARAGHRVTVYAADHGAAPRDEVREGVRHVRRGGKIGVIGRAWFDLAARRLGRVDLVVDVQNGVPFLSPLATRRPVIVLVHHVHREMWPVVYGPRAARLGWWVESRLAPRLYRRARYVAVSRATRDELLEQGLAPKRISVIHNGVDPPRPVAGERDPRPTVTVLGRLVPHKQVIDVLEAAGQLRKGVPGLAVRIVGDGWWAPNLRADALRLGVDDITTFTGFVSEQQKAEELARTWVLAIPSLKEGWGLVVVEAASYGVPAVGYRHAAGVAESIVDGYTGIVVEGGQVEFTGALQRLLTDPDLRARMGEHGRSRALGFSWAETAAAFNEVVEETMHQPHDEQPISWDDEPVTLDGPGLGSATAVGDERR